jgi:hypothetical protein
MRKAKYLSAAAAAAVAVAAAAVMAAMAVIVSCSAAGGSIDSGGDDGTKGLYSITVASGIQNGKITASRSAANANQTVTVNAVPAEASIAESSSGGGGGSNNENLSQWYLTTLSISYDGGKAVQYTKTATNRWTFDMPPGNVVISGTFSQTPVASVNLEILSVSVNSTITPTLEYEVYEYTAKIPHIYPTDTNQKFSIIAIPEDPDATVSISPESQESGGEFPLNEGTSEYTITVTKDGLGKNTYKFTVDYEPDLALKSITLSSTQDETGEWTHTIPLQDGQTLTIPYNTVTIAAIPNDGEVALEASKTGGEGVLGSGAAADTWTLEYSETGNTYALYSTVNIKSTKNIPSGGNYEKDFTLKFEKIVDEDYPTSFWATSTGGGGVSIVKGADDQYYEVHTFTADGTLNFNENPNLTAWVLVVAGGGGGGSANYKSGGGGAGGVVENKNYTLTAQSYNVVVGLGGPGGVESVNADGNIIRGHGTNGGFSQFGQDVQGIKAYGGGGGAGAQWSISPGLAGGSSGGGNSSLPVIPGEGGTSYGHIGGETYSGGNSSPGAGGGGAGGQGTSGGPGGLGISNSISGKQLTYAAGGGTATKTRGANNTGNGGGGGHMSSGGNGGSGIVIVRFPAKQNSGQ